MSVVWLLTTALSVSNADHTAETCAAVAVVSTDTLHPSPVEALLQQEAYDQLLVRPTLNQMQAVDRPFAFA